MNPKCSLSCQRPLTHICKHFYSFLCTLLSKASTFTLVPSEHIPSLVRSTSCARLQIHRHAPSPHVHLCSIYAMLPSIPRGPRPRPPVGRGWVARAPPHPHHSLVASPSQLAVQRPQRTDQAGHQRRRRHWHRDPILASGHCVRTTRNSCVLRVSRAVVPVRRA